MMDSIFHIPILSLATVRYSIISVGYVTEVDVYSQWRTLYKSTSSALNNEQMVIFIKIDLQELANQPQ